MDNLHDKLLQYIFSYLSQRYVATCSSVCKKWLIVARHPKFFKKITIYSGNQLRKFLKIASSVKITKDNIPIGQFVYEMDINNHRSDILEQLHSVYYYCCNIKKIADLPFDFFFPWPTLTNLECEYTNYDRSLSFHRQHSIITSLGYKITHNSNHCTNIIQIQTEQRKSYRRARCLPDSFEGPNYYNGNYVEHYGKTIFFLSPSSWFQLKELCLVFDKDCEQTATTIYDFDERILDTLRETCPRLESLILEGFDMNISDEYRSTITSMKKKVINRHSSLKKLKLTYCTLDDSLCFDYISKFYPNITDLKFFLLWNGYKDDDHDECEDYKLSLFEMITSLNSLKKLSAYLQNKNEDTAISIKDMLWPSLELYQWFIDHPTRLKKLDYPFDLLTIENDFSKKIQSLPLHYRQNVNLNHSLAYIRHLTALTLHLENNLSQVLDYLQSGNHNNHVSLSITSLKIQKYNYKTSSRSCEEGNCFFIYQWLDAFPNVKKLQLHARINIKADTRNQNMGDNQYEQKQTVYKLKELKISNVFIDITSDQLKFFFESCPSLHILELSFVNFLHTNKNPTLPSFVPSIKDENDLDYMIIDIPHLHMDKLIICEPTSGKIREWKTKEGRLYKSIVTEMGSKSTYELVHIAYSSPPVNMIVNCKSIDIYHDLNF